MFKAEKIVSKKVSDLVPSEYNPRQLTEKQFHDIKRSLEGFGFVVPILININKDRKNVIIGGHSRVIVAKEIGIEEVPCVEINLSRDKEREINIRLNKNHGEFDFDMLANMFDIKELKEWGFEERELPTELSEFQEQFDGITDKDAEMPIVPKLSEKYNMYIIVTDNDVDSTFLENVLDIKKSKSYKNSSTGKSHVLTFNHFQKIWQSK